MNAVLETEGLDVRRGPRHVSVLRDISCAVAPGEILMLIGPNGAGKSTLLDALAGDLHPSRGTLRFAGRPLRDWPATTLAQHRAVLTQHTALAQDFTVEETVGLGCLMRGLAPAAQHAVVGAALEPLDLAALRHRAVPALSGGEQARVHLARVMAQVWPLQADGAPRLLLLDEPCASLDPRYQHQICNVVRRFAREHRVAVVMTMHDMNLAAQYADRVLALAQGRCLASGAPREVLTREFVRSCFGVDASTLDAGGTTLLATHAIH